MTRQPYSYRNDPAVPVFDDSRPLFVFDTVCVLCSGGVSYLMRRDDAGKIAFTSAQGDLGQALYRHYGLDMDETYLFLANGRATTMSAAMSLWRVSWAGGGGWRQSAGSFRALSPMPPIAWSRAIAIAGSAGRRRVPC